MLQSKPGITSSGFAPGAASRPVVRGLDNYRVRIQENGLGVNDVSDLSDDHAVPIDPLSAQQIEVIRGPATLRYGSQAIGGVVNVDNNRIPTFIPPRGFAGEVKGALTSVDSGAEGAALSRAAHARVLSRPVPGRQAPSSATRFQLTPWRASTLRTASTSFPRAPRTAPRPASSDIRRGPLLQL